MASQPLATARDERDRQHAAWVAAAAGGDACAFEAFYAATFDLARALGQRFLRGGDLEDLLADVYFEAWRKAIGFDPARGSPVSWLLTLVRSRALDRLRALASSPTAASSRVDVAAITDALAAQAPDPAEQLWQRQAGTELAAALAALSPPERWVLGLAYLRELTHAEIARCTGMPLGTVKSHLQRAQARLRATLSPLQPETRPPGPVAPAPRRGPAR